MYPDGHGGMRSVHSNLPLAKDTIAMIQEFIKANEGKVEWIIAHDKVSFYTMPFLVGSRYCDLGLRHTCSAC